MAALLSLNAGVLAIGATPSQRTPIDSHIPRLLSPFAVPDDLMLSLFAATTPSGRRLSFDQIKPLVVHFQWSPATVYTRSRWHLGIGVFLLNVRPDGRVASVEILRSIGHPTMDRDTVRALGAWRFRPNSVKEVRIPTYYTRVY